MISGSVRAALRAMSPAVITRVPIAVPSARSGKRVAVTTTRVEGVLRDCGCSYGRSDENA